MLRNRCAGLGHRGGALAKYLERGPVKGRSRHAHRQTHGRQGRVSRVVEDVHGEPDWRYPSQPHGSGGELGTSSGKRAADQEAWMETGQALGDSDAGLAGG